MTATQWDNVDIPRDRWGRPMVMLPKSTKRAAYRRTTTFVGCLDDMNGLMKWKARQVAYGMGQRKDLVLAAAAADPADKKLLGELAEKATEHAMSSAGATMGTALHSLTERLDRGQPLGHVPEPHPADLKAYEDATKGIEWLGIETFRVHDDWKIAGTADRIGRDENGRVRIYDIKTGSVDYPHKMAMQLAMYARMTPYDIATDKRIDDPAPVDTSVGIIIHLPAGAGRCDLYEIDIARGWGACLIAKKVWQWRDVKDLTHKVDDERTTTWEKSAIPLDSGLVEAVTTVDDLAALRELWRRAKDAGLLTEDFRAAAQKRSEELAA